MSIHAPSQLFSAFKIVNNIKWQLSTINQANRESIGFASLSHSYHMRATQSVEHLDLLSHFNWNLAFVLNKHTNLHFPNYFPFT